MPDPAAARVAAVRCVRPSRAHEAAFLSALADYRRAQERLYLALYEPAAQDFDAYLARLQQDEAGEALPEGGVPCTHRWLVGADGVLVGNVRVRHRLSWMSELSGGHIGYDVPPAQRGRGFGSCCLTEALRIAREVGLSRVLLTCGAHNLASRRIILKHGGAFDREIEMVHEGLIHRFWIDLADEGQAG